MATSRAGTLRAFTLRSARSSIKQPGASAPQSVTSAAPTTPTTATTSTVTATARTAEAATTVKTATTTAALASIIAAPVIAWRADYGDGEYLLESPGAYLQLDRRRLRKLALVVVQPRGGIEILAEFACRQAIYRRRIRRKLDGTTSWVYLLGCPCHNTLLTIGPDGILPGPFQDIELLPEEQLAGAAIHIDD